MFRHIAWFEIRFWLRSWMLWIFLFIVSLLIFGAISSDEVTVGLNLPISTAMHRSPLQPITAAWACSRC